MGNNRADVSATTVWIRFSNRTGRAEISTELVCRDLSEADRAGTTVTVDGDRRFVVDAPGGPVTYTPAYVGVRPMPWQWELLDRLADTAGAVTGMLDKSGQIRLRLDGKLLDAAGSAMMIDRGWVTVTAGRATVTTVGYRMLAGRLTVATS